MLFLIILLISWLSFNIIFKSGVPKQNMISITFQLLKRHCESLSDSPPPYDSLGLVDFVHDYFGNAFAILRRAQKDSQEQQEQHTRRLTLLASVISVTVFLFISIPLPIAMIVIGALYKDSCPVQKNIPVWLIVAGSFGCLSTFFVGDVDFCLLQNKVGNWQVCFYGKAKIVWNS